MTLWSTGETQCVCDDGVAGVVGAVEVAGTACPRAAGAAPGVYVQSVRTASMLLDAHCFRNMSIEFARVALSSEILRQLLNPEVCPLAKVSILYFCWTYASKPSTMPFPKSGIAGNSE